LFGISWRRGLRPSAQLTGPLKICQKPKLLDLDLIKYSPAALLKTIVSEEESTVICKENTGYIFFFLG
jgi:hypothetical protein